jgi:hypothetical protein
MSLTLRIGRNDVASMKRSGIRGLFWISSNSAPKLRDDSDSRITFHSIRATALSEPGEACVEEDEGGGRRELTNQIVLTILVVYRAWSDAEKPGCTGLIAVSLMKSGL